MSGDRPKFICIGIEDVQSDSRRITIPESAYKLQILTHPSKLPEDPDPENAIGFTHWAYDQKIGWPLIADRSLSFEELDPGEGVLSSETSPVRYKSPQRRREWVTQQPNNTVSIPKPLFIHDENPKQSKGAGVSEELLFEHGQKRFFVTTKLALSNQPNEVKSMFVVNRRQMDTIVNDTVDLNGDDLAPQFA